MYVKGFNSVGSEPRKLIMKNVKLLWKGNDLDLIYWIYIEVSSFCWGKWQPNKKIAFFVGLLLHELHKFIFFDAVT